MARYATSRDWSTQASLTAKYIDACALGDDVAPVATSDLLMEADQLQLDVAVSYCQTALMVDSVSESNGRRFIAVIPPGCNHGRLALTRTVPKYKDMAVLMANSFAGGATFGYGASATDPTDDPVISEMPGYGIEGYLDVSVDGGGVPIPGVPQLFLTEESIDDGAAGPTHRALKLPEAKVATNEWVEVAHHAGVCLIVSTVTTNLETL